MFYCLWPTAGHAALPCLAGAAVCEAPAEQQPLFAKPAPARPSPSSVAGAAGIRGAGELSSVCGPAGGQRAVFCRAGLAGMAPAIGGGLVPRGRDYQPQPHRPVQQPLGEAAEPIYHSLLRCASAQPRASVANTPGQRFSCDGRYNLACRGGGA